MAKLTAIPVGQGDAFLLERADGKIVLVDGGRARSSLAGQVSLATSNIDVVVCTHADADHAEGLIGLLESSLVPIREVWLPGRWSSRLEDLCRDQASFLQELHHDVHNAEGGADLEKIAEGELPRGESTTDFDPELLGAALEHEERLEPDLLSASAHPAWWLPWAEMWPGFHGPNAPKWQLWIDAVQTAVRIRDVARAAHHHGARLRWFDFDEVNVNRAPPSGGEPFLYPLNSVELTKRHALRKLGALHFLALSVANRESLVFLAPQTDDDTPVLFAADSDLACGRVPGTSRTLAVTAPHHGSEANKTAYVTVSRAAANVVWVRSDGNYKKRPGPAFLGEKARVCTLCRSGGASKQTVRLDDTPSGWTLAEGVRGCNCK
ncbi:MAG: MBL fold metallo-hydrolase [Myxococcales bacterium]|nr:MBL fold metallo-hydrolase [Myxococcales bacterium]